MSCKLSSVVTQFKSEAEPRSYSCTLCARAAVPDIRFPGPDVIQGQISLVFWCLFSLAERLVAKKLKLPDGNVLSSSRE